MQTKKAPLARKRTMITAAAIADQARPFAAALVESAEPRLGSRMRAYEQVAATLGVSASWLRKLIGRQHVAVAAHAYLNLAAAYRSLCERIEAQAESEKLRAPAIQEQLNAVLASAPLVVDGAEHAEAFRRIADEARALAADGEA